MRWTAILLLTGILCVFAIPAAAQPLPIAEARLRPSGTFVTIRGRVTAANEFGGPSFVQDATAGIAVYAPDFHSAVMAGDSVEVSGTLSEFQNGGTAGRGLLQVSGTVTFSVFPGISRLPVPVSVSLQALPEALEGSLVQVPRVETGAFETFRSGSNYWITDGSAASQIRIYANTGLGGTAAPDGPAAITGILSEFRGQRQILPRSARDFVPKPRRYDGMEAGRSLTLMTWNAEWFGDPLNGPADDALQVRQAAALIQSISPDIAALQEIASPARFRELLGLLPGYSGFTAPFAADQKTAYLYRRETVDSVSAGLLAFPGNEETGGPFAGRLPFEFQAVTKHAGQKPLRLRLVNMHAKAFADASSYQRRVTAASLLKPVLDGRTATAAVVFAGDLNDDLDASIYAGQPSPYRAFVADTSQWLTPTLRFSRGNLSSYSGGSTDPIDHILFSKNLLVDALEPDVWIQQVAALGSFSQTVSDHYPVVALIPLQPALSNGELPVPMPDALQVRSYPNPFNPVAMVEIKPAGSGPLTASLFDVTGRILRTYRFSAVAGQTVRFPIDLSGRAAGVYFLRIQDAENQTVTHKLTLLK